MKKAMETDGGDGYTAVELSFMSLTCPLEQMKVVNSKLCSLAQ